MNWLDLLIIMALVGGAIDGLSRGLVRSAIGLLGFWVGLMLAGQRYAELAPLFFFVADPSLARVIAFAAIFLSVLLVATLLGQLLHYVVGLIFFGCLDRILGAVFGTAVAAMILQTFLIIATRFPLPGLELALRKSALMPYLSKLTPLLLSLLPKEFESIQRFLP
ncbi:MAG: CvpA family protein [Chloroflexi bacterium]|nr:CvpA family protein [Chloroflexota bacterium]MCL5075358.1 CvpA family protein [Chloroflexota bacterium]